MELAQILFESYNNAGAHPWKTYDGKTVPGWDGLSSDVKEKWRAAADRSLQLAGELPAADPLTRALAIIRKKARVNIPDENDPTWRDAVLQRGVYQEVLELLTAAVP